MKTPFTLAATLALTLTSVLLAQTGTPASPSGGAQPGPSISGQSGISGQAGPSSNGGQSGSSAINGQSGEVRPGSPAAGSASGSRTNSPSDEAANSPADEQKEFAMEASSGNNLEIQTGQFVADHTQNQQVKQFAQTLVQDHQKAEQQLKQAAQQAGLSNAEELMPVHKAMLQEIEKKSGKDLDREFIFSAVADHQKDILEYTYASQNLQNAQLKQYASQNLSVLQKHYQTAEELARDVIGVRSSPTASIR